MLRFTTALTLLPIMASAEAPSVITDIAPVHSLVARVMEGAGAPDLLLPPTASPHDFSLRPSDAQRLTDADLVVWVGENLTPMLEGPIEDLASDAQHLELLASEGWPHRFIEAETPEHAHRSTPDAEHEHEHHASEDEEHEHHHSGLDPHAWLDPVVAQAWTQSIAAALAEIDPENAALYTANADVAQRELASLRAGIEARLSGVSGAFVVPHDAYGYFTDRFGLEPAGEITLSDAQTPGPARIARLKEQVAQGGIACVLTDPQVSAKWSDLLREETDARSAQIDPLGSSFDPGPDHYAQTLEALAEGIATCLGR